MRLCFDCRNRGGYGSPIALRRSSQRAFVTCLTHSHPHPHTPPLHLSPNLTTLTTSLTLQRRPSPKRRESSCLTLWMRTATNESPGTSSRAPSSSQTPLSMSSPIPIPTPSPSPSPSPFPHPHCSPLSDSGLYRTLHSLPFHPGAHHSHHCHALHFFLAHSSLPTSLPSPHALFYLGGEVAVRHHAASAGLHPYRRTLGAQDSRHTHYFPAMTVTRLAQSRVPYHGCG